MNKPKLKSAEHTFESELAFSSKLRLVPVSSARQPIEGEFPPDQTGNDPEQRQRAVGKLIDFFKKY